MSRVLHRSLAADPPLAVRGEGIFLLAADGRKIIDGSGGAAVACLGHGDARVNAAIAAQLARVAYVHTALFSNAAAEELADMLLAGEPGGLSHAFFVLLRLGGIRGGAEAGAPVFSGDRPTERTRVIARRQGYHGTTLGALSAGGNAMRRAP